jgi:Colicin V production protein.
MQNALSAVVGGLEIIDVVIIAIFALAVLVGVATGCAKQFRGFLGTVFALGAAVAVIVFLREQLLAISLFKDIENAILDKLVDLGAAFNNPARLLDGALQVKIDGAWIALPEAVQDATFKIVVQYGEGIITKLVGARLDGVSSIATVLASMLGTIIAYVIGFLASFIVVKIILVIFATILINLINGKKSLKRFDRALGLVMSAIAAFVLVFAVFFVFKKFPDNSVVQKATAMVESSTSVAKWIWDLVTV